MANRKRALSPPTPPTPLRARNQSIAVQSSPLLSGSLISFPVTTASFESSPNLSHSDNGSGSPEYLEPFEYTSDMDVDFQRIDTVASASQLEVNDLPSGAESQANSPPPTRADSPPPPAHAESRPLTPYRKQKIWVVFQGREPGIYDCMVLASFQTQGFSNNFQRTYLNCETAEAAWCAYMRDGTFPGYGRPPWVIFIGRWVGVTERVTELENSVKNFKGALFRSCSSVVEGNIKLQLFIDYVTKLFADADPFSGAGSLITQSGPSRGDRSQGDLFTQPAAPSLTPRQRHPYTSRVVGSSALARLDADHGLPLASSTRARHVSTPHHSEGWYVVYHGSIPGIYQGFKAFSGAGAEPGGFQCAPDEESAKRMYLELATNGMITWAGMEEPV